MRWFNFGVMEGFRCSVLFRYLISLVQGKRKRNKTPEERVLYTVFGPPFKPRSRVRWKIDTRSTQLERSLLKIGGFVDLNHVWVYERGNVRPIKKNVGWFVSGKRRFGGNSCTDMVISPRSSSLQVESSSHSNEAIPLAPYSFLVSSSTPLTQTLTTCISLPSTACIQLT